MQKLPTLDTESAKRFLAVSQRTGAVAFLIVATIQALILFAGFLLMHWIQFGYVKSEEQQTVREFLEYVMRPNNGLLHFSIIMVVLVGLSWPVGRWAGREIGVGKRNFAWISLRALILPSLGASLCFCFLEVVHDTTGRDWEIARQLRALIPSSLLFSVIMMVVGILPALVAGLVVRQRLAVVAERG